jgi:nucleoside-diphosphate-sugar epimerase
MRVFVTGATGVIGRRVVPLLLARGDAVTAVARTAEKRAALEPLGAAVVGLDLFDLAAARRALDGHDAIVNLATHMPRSTTRMMLPGAWRENDRVRTTGSATLVEAARQAGVRRFVQESFAPMYEDGGARWIDERHPVRPARYNRSTLDAERAATGFTDEGSDGIVLRFSWFYGGDSAFLREMIGVVRRGWSPLPGSFDAFVSSISHDDAATAVVAALGVPSGTYNVTDDTPVTRGEWTASLAAALGVRAPRPMPRWLARLGGSASELMARPQRMSNQKLRAASDWSPKWASVRDAWPTVVRELVS